MIIVAGHAGVVNGKIYEAPVNTLTELLKARRRRFLHLRHSIDGQLPSIGYWFASGELEKEVRLPVIAQPSVLRYLSEILVTFGYLLFTAPRPVTYIGADPLNAVTGVLLRKLGRIDRAIFYTADYAVERFKNPVLNNIYHALDRFCARQADEVWNVSSRIQKVRQQLGVSPERNIFLPNVPSDKYKPYLKNPRQRFQLVTLGLLGDQLDFENLFLAMVKLQPKYPQMTLKIAGNGPKEAALKKFVADHHLGQIVEFLGHLSHEAALDTISHSGIGLALYNGNWSFNYYGDSMKCREFFCFGLPVLTTDTHSTVDDIKTTGAGLVSPMDAQDYAQALEEIWKNYNRYSEAAKKLAEEYDGIHEKQLRRLPGYDQS